MTSIAERLVTQICEESPFSGANRVRSIAKKYRGKEVQDPETYDKTLFVVKFAFSTGESADKFAAEVQRMPGLSARSRWAQMAGVAIAGPDEEMNSLPKFW